MQSERQNERYCQRWRKKRKRNSQVCELKGKKLGIIGLGAIGVLVANAAVNLGMEVLWL